MTENDVRGLLARHRLLPLIDASRITISLKRLFAENGVAMMRKPVLGYFHPSVVTYLERDLKVGPVRYSLPGQGY